MTKKNHKKEDSILLAYGFDGNGTAFQLDAIGASDELKNDGLAWVHLDANNSHTASWLKKEVSYLDQIIIDALLADETRPRIMEFDQGSLIIFRGVNLNENAKPEDMVSIRLWIDDTRIISIQKRNVKAIRNIEAVIKTGKTIKNSGEFVSILCRELSECLELFLEEMGTATDEIEGKILDTHTSDLRENTITIRKQAIMLKRHIAPQRDVVSQLVLCNQAWMSDLDKRHFHESYNHLTRYVEDLDEIRERSQIVHDELTNAITERVNKNMYVLSVIASIFLPLTFLTGMFGMNVGGIPGNVYPDAFYIVAGSMIAVAGLQILLFKKKKWF
jgi:zinc transporter